MPRKSQRIFYVPRGPGTWDFVFPSPYVEDDMKNVLAYAAVGALCTIAPVLIGCQADQELNPTEPDITAVSSKTAGILVSRPAKITQT